VLRPFALSLFGLAVVACGSDDGVAADTGAPPADASPDVSMDAPPDVPETPVLTHLGPDDRPARIIVPPAHDGVTPLPIIFLLHGYGANATLQDAILGTSLSARTLGYYLVMPEGTVDPGGDQFWNATDWCCDRYDSGVDDVAYLTALLDEAEAALPVDTGRVYFMGHSNGAAMSYRMACELSERVTAIVTLAGGDYLEPERCVPSEAVSVLHIHGSADESVPIGGDENHPPALEMAERWAARAACDLAAVTDLEPIDLEVVVDGAETNRLRWETGCEPGRDVELWTMTDVGHLPVFDVRPFGVRIAEWLIAHDKM